MIMRILVPMAILMLFSGNAKAIILLGLDNSANQTDPGTGVPFDAVARVSNALSGSIGGSAVHLGNGWMITANHIGAIAYTTFDGSTFYNRDVSVLPQRIGTTDMKLFRLETTPTVGAARIYSGTSENTGPATLIGWGRGRDPNVPVNSTTVNWSNSLSTSAKRWGLNRPATIINDSYTHSLINYEQESILTVLGDSTTGLGANEAAAITHDSGSGMFQQISGEWYMIGLATRVEVANVSTFGDDNIASLDRGDVNFFIRMGTYEDDIMAIVPEPSTTVVTGLFAVLALMRRQRVL